MGKGIKHSATAARFLESVLQRCASKAAPSPGGTFAVSPPSDILAGGSGPEFWADAPWRLEPDRDAVPFTFILRDGDDGVELEYIAVYEAEDDGTPLQEKTWQPVSRFPHQGAIGPIKAKFWVYRPSPQIPLTEFKTICRMAAGTPVPVRGQRLLLKIVYKGSRKGAKGQRQPFEEQQWLIVSLAKEPLPLRRSSRWYYGDTHYHSSYTNNLIEFGNPIPDTRTAGECIGLDWLIVTDHSVDLADENPYFQDTLPTPDERWEALRKETRANSDGRYRILCGEEVTLKGAWGDPLHMLVFGTGFEKAIPGATFTQGFLKKVINRLTDIPKELYDYLFGKVYGLKVVLNGTDEPAMQGRSVKEQGALAFAAHPVGWRGIAGSWEPRDLRPVNGMEAWNGNIRHRTGEEVCPFDHWKEFDGWVRRFNEVGITTWDQMLAEKVWDGELNYVLLGGSDAHGSFNYSLTWSMDLKEEPVLTAEDNCLGRVRTLLYLPKRGIGSPRQAPDEQEIVEAIGAGSCVVTDGPVLTFTMSFDGHEAGLGQTLVVNGDGTLETNVHAEWTDEFGPVTSFNLIYYFQGRCCASRFLSGIYRGLFRLFPFIRPRSKSRMVSFQAGHSEVIGELPPGSGYVRLETTTTSGGETFRCLTNPIWIKSKEGNGKRTLRVNCAKGTSRPTLAPR